MPQREKDVELTFDMWEVDQDGPWVSLRLSNLKDPGRGHIMHFDPAGALAIGRALERYAAPAALVENHLAALAEKHQTRKRTRIFGRRTP